VGDIPAPAYRGPLGFSTDSFLLAGNESSAISYSINDGTTWSATNASGLANVNTIAWNGQYWLAGGNNAATTKLARSTDGINWSAVATPPTGMHTIHKIDWNGQYWLATGQTSSGSQPPIYISKNGINWTGCAVSGLSYGLGAAWNGSIWVVVGQSGGSTNNVHTSYDGTIWTGTGLIINNSTNIRAVAWNGREFVAVADYVASNDITYVSPNGMTWTGVSSGLTFDGISVASNGTNTIAIGTNSSGNSQIAIQTTDGTWTKYDTSAPLNNLRAITWSGYKWVVTCGSGLVATSTTGAQNSWLFSKTTGAGVGQSVASRIETLPLERYNSSSLRIVYAFIGTNSNTPLLTVSFSTFPAGYYFITFTNRTTGDNNWQVSSHVLWDRTRLYGGYVNTGTISMQAIKPGSSSERTSLNFDRGGATSDTYAIYIYIVTTNLG
jgi:hypothetical protein